MAKVISIKTAAEQASDAFDELFDFIEQNQAVIDRYNELTAKYERLTEKAVKIESKRL